MGDIGSLPISAGSAIWGLVTARFGVSGSTNTGVMSEAINVEGEMGGVGNGKAAGGGAGVAEGDFDNENLPTRLDMKLPIPAPQEVKRAGEDDPDEVSVEADDLEAKESMLVCFNRVGCMKLLVEEEAEFERELSGSGLVTSSGSSKVVMSLWFDGVAGIGVVGTAADGVVGALRCQRSRTPSTALKKLNEPAVRVRVTASRAGASCCSILSS